MDVEVYSVFMGAFATHTHVEVRFFLSCLLIWNEPRFLVLRHRKIPKGLSLFLF